MVRQTARWGQVLLLSLVGLGATAFTTACIYRIDEVISVQGRLVPEKGGVEVKSPMGGQLVEIFVKPGERVKEGDQLVRYDVDRARSEKKTIDKQIEIESLRLNDQLDSNKQRERTIERNIQLNKRILNRLIPLEKEGAISELQILQQENNLEAQKDQLIQLKNEKGKLINESGQRLTELTGKLEQAKIQLKYETIKAPITGTVFDLKVDNSKYVTRNAETLMKIVPIGVLAGEVNMTNQDIGFIRKGQTVKVRIDSFPYTEYGEITGTIENVGADALPPTQLIPQYHFPVKINMKESKLETKDGAKIELQAGMTITTIIKLRDRRLIELLSDLFTNKSESLERLRQP